MSEIQKIARERSMSAADAAKKLGRSPRTIRRLVALDRDEYLERAAERREMAWNMRILGDSWEEIAERIGTTAGGARSLYYQHRKKMKEAEKASNKKCDKTADLFD